VSCCGHSFADLNKRYPLFLREFIWYKLKESDGLQDGHQELKKSMWLPWDIAEWLESDPYTRLEQIRHLMRM
jgi:hypothetical protein